MQIALPHTVMEHVWLKTIILIFPLLFSDTAVIAGYLRGDDPGRAWLSHSDWWRLAIEDE